MLTNTTLLWGVTKKMKCWLDKALSEFTINLKGITDLYQTLVSVTQHIQDNNCFNLTEIKFVHVNIQTDALSDACRLSPETG